MSIDVRYRACSNILPLDGGNDQKVVVPNEDLEIRVGGHFAVGCREWTSKDGRLTSPLMEKRKDGFIFGQNSAAFERSSDTSNELRWRAGEIEHGSYLDPDTLAVDSTHRDRWWYVPIEHGLETNQ